MIEEYQIVRAKRNLSTLIHHGCRGTVVMVFESPELGYLVEFMDDLNNSIDVITVHPDDIELS